MESIIDISDTGLTRIEYTDNSLNRKVSKSLLQNVGDYFAPWWYFSHFGGLIGFGDDPELVYEQDIMLDVEEQLQAFSIEWYPRKPYDSENSNNLNIILLFPGVGAGIKNKFCKKFCQYFGNRESEGYHYLVAVITARGVDIELHASKCWYPGIKEDGLQALQNIHDRYPLANLFLVGYSAGANMMQRIINDKDRKVPIKGAVSVLMNIDYIQTRTDLENTLWGGFYSFLICTLYKITLTNNLKTIKKIDPKFITNLENCKNARYISDFDVYGWQLFGFPDQKSYYEALSTISTSQEAIPCPFLVIQPLDDPLHCGKVREHLNPEKLIKNSNIIYCETKYGNHFGFYQGSLLGAFSNKKCYLYPAIMSKYFFNEILN
jgi:predicted alpha/beta-fold hydrolase